MKKKGICSAHCCKEASLLAQAIRDHTEQIRNHNSSHLTYGRHWEKSDFRPIITSLHQAFKTYSTCELARKFAQRVRALRWRMIFMSDDAIETEAHLLADELEAFLDTESRCE